MRRIAAEHIIATGNKDKRWTDVYLHLEEEVKTAVEALQAVIRQMGEQAAVLAKDGMAARAQVDALQRVRDEFERERDQLNAALMEAKAALDAEREKVKGLHEITKVICTHCCEPMEIPSKAVLQTQLTQLQALVRALPVPEEGGFPIVEVDGDYYVNHTSRFSTKAEADAYTGLLIYRATLDATTPARGQELEDK